MDDTLGPCGIDQYNQLRVYGAFWDNKYDRRKDVIHGGVMQSGDGLLYSWTPFWYYVARPVR